MKLTDTQIAQFREDGFLILPSLFSPDEVRVLKAELPRLFAERRPENFREKRSDAVRTAMALHRRSEVYARLVRHRGSWSLPGRSSATTSTSSRSR